MAKFLHKNRNKTIIAVLVVMLSAVFVFTSVGFAQRRTVTILEGEKKYTLTVSTNTTVGESLEKAGITLSEDDQVSMNPEEEVGQNTTVYIQRDVHRQSQSIKTKEDTSVLRKTKAKLPAVKPAQHVYTPGKVNVGADTKNYLKKVTVTATAYCSCPICCGPYGVTTADGSKPRAYHTIATPSTYRFGTNVYIPYFKNSPNGGIFEVEDRGGAIQGNRIDIYFDTHQQALNFGRRTLTMYVLK